MKFGTALAAMLVLLVMAALAGIISAPFLIAMVILAAISAVYPPAGVVIAALVILYLLATRGASVAARVNSLLAGKGGA